MKKLIIITVLALTFFTVEAQKGKVFSITVDTLQGNETVNFNPVSLTGTYQSLVVQALCTELGGTSDGTLVLDASVDGISYETITETTGLLYGFPNDTLTIVDAAVATWLIQEPPWKYYRVKGAGTASDTTLVTIKFIYK